MGPNSSPDRRQKNRRAFPRWPAEFEVRYGTGKNLQPGLGKEIGEGGLSLEGELPFPLEAEIDVQYRLKPTDEKGWVAVKAAVRHSEGKHLGVEFLNLGLKDRVKIVEFVSALTVEPKRSS